MHLQKYNQEHFQNQLFAIADISNWKLSHFQHTLTGILDTINALVCLQILLAPALTLCPSEGAADTSSKYK